MMHPFLKLKVINGFSLALLGIAGILLTYQSFNFITGRYIYLEKIEITGGEIVVNKMAENVLAPLENQNLLHLDLLSWRSQLENLPGIARANLYRVPHKRLLKVNLDLHQPLARWDEGGMVNIFGQRYASEIIDSALPVFKGEEERLVEISEFYDDASQILKGIETIAQLELTPRGSWILFLENGLLLRLGHDKPRERLSRYVRYQQVLSQKFPNVYIVDLRYERGFSLVDDRITKG